MTSSDDLIQNVYAYFLKAYHAGAAGASGSEVVAFEPMGFSPGCVGVQGPGISNAALQEVSRLADVLPETDGGVYKETGRTISVQYSATIVEGAQPTAGASVEAFSNLKSLARKLYNDAESDGELDGPKATLATPADWYDLQNASNWSTYCYNSSTQIQVPAPAAPQAPNVHLAWQVVNQEMRPQILQQSAQFVSTPNPATGLHPMVTRATMMATAPVAMRPAAPITAVAPRPTAVEIPSARPTAAVILTTRASVAQVAAQTAPQPVESASFKLSFDYCLVHLRRSWLSGDFLAMPGWYVPTARGGDYSTGSPLNKGWFAAIPTAFIAVKNLVISGSWSANDVTAAGNSAAFGPFSLLGISASQSGVLTNPGVQIIAWICSPQAKLPPDDDPKLALAAPATGS